MIIRLAVGGVLMMVAAVLWVAVGFQVGLKDSESTSHIFITIHFGKARVCFTFNIEGLYG